MDFSGLLGNLKTQFTPAPEGQNSTFYDRFTDPKFRGLLAMLNGMGNNRPIVESVQAGTQLTSSLIAQDENKKRKEMIDKLITEGGFTAQEQALIRASDNPASVAVQIRNQKATFANKPLTSTEQKYATLEKLNIDPASDQGKRFLLGFDTNPAPTPDKTLVFGDNLLSISSDNKVTTLQTKEPKSGSSNTALMNNFNFIKSIMPSLSDEDILSRVKGGDTFNLGNDVQISGDFVITPDPNSEAGFKATVIPGSKTDLAQQNSANKQNVKKTASQTSTESQASSGSLVLEEIERAKTAIEANPLLTTGLGAQLTSGIGGSPAANVRALIDPIKANIGFDRLQRMRKESPTGGALGQVAVRELEFLQSVFGSLDQEQKSSQLLENLGRLSGQYKTSMLRILNAAIKDQKDGVLNVETGQVINPLDYFNQSEIDMLTGNTSGDLANFASQVEAAKTVYDLDRLSKMPNITSEDRDLLKKKLEQF